MRVLVCGGRSFDDLPLLDRTLDELHAGRPITTVIHGGAAGADTMAHFWAGAAGVPIDVYLARWKEHGKAAGPIRNQRMLDEGKPDLVVAFPGGRGTADMIRRAERAGVPVRAVAKREGELTGYWERRCIR
jgi:YspA, cpYpsA-related SLOG family